METFSAEDILIDNLSFKLNKGASYINDRRSVSFFLLGVISTLLHQANVC